MNVVLQTISAVLFVFGLRFNVAVGDLTGVPPHQWFIQGAGWLSDKKASSQWFIQDCDSALKEALSQWFIQGVY